MLQRTKPFRLGPALGVVLCSVMFSFSLTSKANAQFQTYPIPSSIEIIIASTNGIINVTTIGDPCNPVLPATVVRLDRVTCNVQATTPSLVSFVSPNLFTRCYVEFGSIFPNELFVDGTCSYDPVSQRLIVF